MPISPFDVGSYTEATQRALAGLRRDVEMLKRRRYNDVVVYPIKVVDEDSALLVADGQFVFAITSVDNLDGYTLTAAATYVTTVSSSGLPTVRLRNLTKATTITSTNITIDVSEYTSDTAATPGVIAAASIVNTGDRISIDVTVAGTGAKGLGVVLKFAFLSY